MARYDSRDGYGAHPREADYVAAAAPDVSCPAPVAAVQRPAATPSAVQRFVAPVEPRNQPAPDLDCSDIRRTVRITSPDYHRLDADGSGWGCESYG